MFCKYCGTKAGAAGFCTSCGKALPLPNTPAPAGQPAHAPAQRTTPPAAAHTPPPAATPQPAAQHSVAAPQTTSPAAQTPAPSPQPQSRVSQRDPRRKSGGLKLLSILGASVLVLAAAGGAIWWLVGDRADSEISESEAMSYGSNDEWDALWDRCEAGALSACDQLYRVSPVGSDYEDFGGSCGNRGGSPGFCQPEAGEEGPTEGGFGTDPQLDLLWVECEEGNMFACDDLFFSSAPGTIYEDFGATCGGRGTGDGDCVSEFP